VPEVPGDIIAPAPLKVAGAGFSLPIALPATPGRYRLEVTLFDAHGVAFDSASQALLPTMDVRVTGDVDGAILVAPTMTLTAGSAVELPVRIVNLGTDPWGHAAILDPTGRTIGMPASAAMVVGWWLPSGAALDPTALEPALAPVVTADALVALTVPQTPGVYVLLLDLVTPEDGSLMAAGIGPTAVRITVVTPR